MARRLVTMDEAFDELSRMSHRLNRTLHDTAEVVVNGGVLPDAGSAGHQDRHGLRLSPAGTRYDAGGPREC
jgi:hypothetical protein